MRTQACLSLSQRASWSAGQPISDLMHRALANPELISLAAGFVDQQTLPTEPVKKAFHEVWSELADARSALQYGTTPGVKLLREALLARHRLADGRTSAGTNVENVVITAGSNQLLHLVSESLVDPGDIVLCAAPTYLVYLGTLANVGARAVSIFSDRNGIVPEALDEYLKDRQRSGDLGRVKLVYVVTYFDNPSGITMPSERREQILNIVQRYSSDNHRIVLIEDIAYRDLRYAGEDVPTLWSLDEEHEFVVLAGTFSKCFSPGVRVGWGMLPSFLVDPVCQQKGNIDFGSPNFNQHLMAKVLELGMLDDHIQQIRREYQRKLAAMLSAAEEFLRPLRCLQWQSPLGGLYVWLQLPNEMDAGPAGTLFDRAIDEGVLYVPGQFCYPSAGQPVARNCLRLSFGVQSCDGIHRGMAALARAIESELS